MTLQDTIKEITEQLALSAQHTLDYEIGWTMAEALNKPTSYKGKGRPRNSDYLILKHPFDGKIKKVL